MDVQSTPNVVKITPLAAGKSMPTTSVKSEITTPNKLISITIPTNQMNPLMPIQVVNMMCQQSNRSTDKAQPQHHNERRLLKRPKVSSPTTEKRRQANLMHIEELQRGRRQRGNRSRMRLFSSGGPQRESSHQHLSPALPQHQLEILKDKPKGQTALDTWVLVATGQSDHQRQLTQQARTFLQLNPHSPKRPPRIAVVPLLRMNCTATLQDSQSTDLIS